MRLDLATWPEVEAYLNARGESAGILLPVGSTEQHGPMGLIGTDALCAAAIAEATAARAETYVAPVLAYTPAPFNTGFPGTVSVSEDLFSDLFGQVVTGLQRQGFSKVYVLNAHGANQAPMMRVVQDLGDAGQGVRIRSWWSFDAVNALRAELYGDWEGLHATPSEVAITQALFRQVDPGVAATPPRMLSAQERARRAGDRHGPARLHRQEFPDGRVGAHSALARPEHGRQLLDVAARCVAEDFRVFAAGQASQGDTRLAFRSSAGFPLTDAAKGADMTVMQGFPPAEGDRATLANWRTAPFSAWAFHHVREIVPSAEIANDPENVWALERDAPILPDADIAEGLQGLANDALVILHKGRIVHESYRNGMKARDPHILMSVSKSMLGLLAGTLVERGELDPDAPLTEYVPELAATAYAGASVRNALDMRVGVEFTEDYFATEGPIIDYRYAANWNPVPAGVEPHDLRSFQSVLTQTDGPHGGRFHYVSPVTDLLAWVCERASGMRYADLFARRIWQPMGAEFPACITVDRIGGARAAGGMCVAARDLARVGQLMLQDGARGGTQIIPASWLADIADNGDRQAWRDGDFYEDFGRLDMAYRSKWYVHADGLMHGLGIHGQYLFVDRARDLSIAMLSSEAEPIDMGWTRAALALVGRIRAAVG